MKTILQRDGESYTAIDFTEGDTLVIIQKTPFWKEEQRVMLTWSMLKDLLEIIEKRPPSDDRFKPL